MLTSPEKGETAAHCCDPALSILVMLVSRNLFHVVSALQSIVCLYIFSADQVFCRSYVGSAYRLQSLAVSGSSKRGILKGTEGKISTAQTRGL